MAKVKGKNIKTGADDIKEALLDIRRTGTEDMKGDRDVAFYTRGWNMAMEVAIAVLNDFVMLSESEV